MKIFSASTVLLEVLYETTGTIPVLYYTTVVLILVLVSTLGMETPDNIYLN